MEDGRKIENHLRNIREAKLKRGQPKLLEMADELHIAYEAQIAIIIFSKAGTIFEYSTPSSRVEEILLRRSNMLGSSEVSKEAESGEVQVFKNKIAELKEKLLLLSSVLEGKEKVIVLLEEKARLQEQSALLENEKLHEQIEKLQSLYRSRENITLQLFPCPVEMKSSIVQDNAVTPDVMCVNSSVAEDEESNINLQLALGLSSNARGPW